MGSWSVYCGLSNIAITVGDKVGIIPITKRSGANFGYTPFVSAMLPVFGTYDDYGGIENIEENSNTKLIENYFGITIKQFVECLLNGNITYARDEVKGIYEELKNREDFEKLNFTFVSRKIYDYLSKTSTTKVGNFNFGNETILKLLGFKYVETLPSGRYNKVYELKGKQIYTDGTWAEVKGENRRHSIFYFNSVHSKECNLTNYFEISKDKYYIKELAEWQLKEIYTTEKQYGEYIFDHKYDFEYSKTLDELLKSAIDSKLSTISEEGVEHLRTSLETASGKASIQKEYLTNLTEYGKDISKLYTVLNNLTVMSKCLEPYILYITPQCGEHKAHLELLKGFVKILEKEVEE